MLHHLQLNTNNLSNPQTHILLRMSYKATSTNDLPVIRPASLIKAISVGLFVNLSSSIKGAIDSKWRFWFFVSIEVSIFVMLDVSTADVAPDFELNLMPVSEKLDGCPTLQ
jgi:hypothetical protein